MILPEKVSSNAGSEYSVVDSEHDKTAAAYATKAAPTTTTKKKSPVTLYNFGYAPKPVIEKFQSFCFNYSTLTEAITNLMRRKSLLKYKYNYISSNVTFQMLARPTSLDDTGAIRNALLALHKFTKDGHYKSVADAIEELLLSPKPKSKSQSNCTASTQTAPLGLFETTGGLINDNQNYARVSTAEEIALNKIADAVINRLQEKIVKKVNKTARAGKHKLPDGSSPSSVSPKRKKSPKTSGTSSPASLSSSSDTNSVFNINGYSQLVGRLSSMDPDYEPAGIPGGNTQANSWAQGDQKRVRRKTKLLHDYSKLMQNDESGSEEEEDTADLLPPDIELLNPLYRLRKNYRPEPSGARYRRLFSLSPKFFQLGSVKLAPCSLDVADKAESLLKTVSESA